MEEESNIYIEETV